MYCSDCHGAANEESGDPKGPHGSSYKYMLKGPNKLWPIGNAEVPFSLNDISGKNKSDGFPLNTDWSTTLFCLNCHPIYSGGQWMTKAHKEHNDKDYKPDGTTTHNVYCIACHSVIPHGNKRSRLIVYGREGGYGVDVEPYIYVSGTVTYSVMSGFKKAAGPDNYNQDDCYVSGGQDIGCGQHKDDKGGYDP
jgi:hypothetical protein